MSFPTELVEEGPGDPKKPKPFDPAKAEAEVKALRDQHASDADIDAYLHQAYGLTPHATREPIDIPDYVAPPQRTPGVGMKILGTLGSLGRDIPGVDAAQAGVRSAGRTLANKIGLPVEPESYREALANVHGLEAAAPAAATIPARMIGGTVAAMALPKIPGLAQGGVGLQGAQFGALSGLASSDPDRDLSGRLHDATKQGVFGALAGKATEGLTTLGRSVGAKTLGQVDAARRGAITATDNVLYPKAAAEANTLTNQPIPQPLLDALNAPDVKPYTSVVAGSREFSKVNDQGLPRAARLLRDVYKELTDHHEGLLQSMKVNGYSAPVAREASNIALAKQQLLAAADQVMPSFREAVQVHAEGEGALEAMQSASDAAQRAMAGSRIKGRKLGTQSQEAVLESLGKLSPNESGAATEGLLGRAKENIGFSANPLTGFGVGKSAIRLGRLAPLLNQVDRQTGTLTPEVLRALGITIPSDLLKR